MLSSNRVIIAVDDVVASSTTDYLVAGLAKNVKVNPSLHSFGFIPKKRSRDSPDEITPLRY